MKIGGSIHDTIDFEGSKMRNTIAIQRGVDRHLDKLLHQYAEMHAYADEAVRVCSEHLPREARNRIQSCTVFPQLGFLLVVEPDPVTGMDPFDVHDRQGRPWERMFTAEESVCYKNEYLRQLDEHYGGTWNAIGGL
jgi:DNA mismatch repair protein MSH5